MRYHHAFVRQERGQSLIETAFGLPILVMLICYAVDFGYFFMVEASIDASAHNAAMYATQGSVSTTGTAPPLGTLSTAKSVAGMAYSNMSGYLNASTKMAVQLCTNNNATVSCNSTGDTSMISGSYQPDEDPEPTVFQLVRVDVVYTVNPPIPLTYFGTSLLPTLNFHRMAEMRIVN